ncbi:cytochrome C [Sulfitobacter sp. SK012]|uniref:c-type cytochrome n=1 Tax=Sulfitobacter sp. SK012 TaxID=1389005 RepID=UPI000E0C8525|nr:cytochrome c [Sulfitobacter sp. SK012]AXI45245.1 cytochrome C [Sulfitobacter sp. SK012]
MRRLTLLIAAVLLPANIAFAQDRDEGEDLYMTYCASCHGAAARGKGPMSAILMLAPTDLTKLTTVNGGDFPISRVIARIDGRDPLVAHGSPMPVFGNFFEGRGKTMRDETGVLIMTSQPILDMVAFLQAVQE